MFFVLSDSGVQVQIAEKLALAGVDIATNLISR